MKKLLLLLLFISAVFIITTCTEEGVNNPVGNQPPDTGLFLYPDSTISPQQSRLTVYWWGDDKDGLIVGYYFSWNEDPWEFTASNDSLFALQIGANDTTYRIQVSAVDNGGNNIYDQQVIRNAIDYGPEPFIDMPALAQAFGGDPLSQENLEDRRAHVHWLAERVIQGLESES